MKTIQLKKGGETLHVEAPGAIINIDPSLKDADGRAVTRVDVSADGDRYAGDPPWWCPDAGNILDARGIGVRIVEGVDQPVERYNRTQIEHFLNLVTGVVVKYNAERPNLGDREAHMKSLHNNLLVLGIDINGLVAAAHEEEIHD